MREWMGSDKWTIPRSMLLRVLIPTLFSAGALALSNIADAVTVGQRMGESALAAIGIVTPVYFVYNVISLSFGIGGSITHTRLNAEGQTKLALAHFRRILRAAGIISLAIALAGGLFPELILRLLAATEEEPVLWQMCMEYARPLLIACPVVLFSYMLSYFVQSDDDPRRAAQAMTAGGVLDVALNVLFVLIFGWGVKGAVWATITAQIVSLAIQATHFFGSRGILRFREIAASRVKDYPESRKLLRTSFRNGFASSVSYVYQFLSRLLMNHLLMRAGIIGAVPGTLYVAAYGLIMNISYLAMPVYTAMGDSLQPAVATFSAERDQESLSIIKKMSLQMGLILGMLVALALGVFAGLSARIFGLREADQLAVAIPAIRIYLLSAPIAGIQTILLRFYQAQGKTWYTFLATTFREALFLIPLTLIFGLAFPAVVWWVFPLAEALALLASYLTVRFRERRSSQAPFPACRVVMTNQTHGLAAVMEQIESFCDEYEVPPGKAMQIQLAVEELSAVTMQQAFSGKKGEYIQVVLVLEPGPRYVLHIRDSAPFFNPLNMETEKAQKDMEAGIMDSIGVTIVRKQSKSIVYRNYQGFNTLTVVYE